MIRLTTASGCPGATWRAFILLCFLPFCVPAAVAGERGLLLRPDGPAEVVFRWAAEACETYDYPDAPARAFRDAAGRVHLLAPHFVNRGLSGPGLDQVRPDCRVLFQGGRRDDPAAFDDRAWLTSFHTGDGRTVYALVHNEFQGHRRPALCPSRRYLDCWYNVVLGAVSHDGGLTFERQNEVPLVAALPYRYEALTGHHSGFFNPTNILERDGFYYVFVYTEARGGQRRGSCLLRTGRLDDPGSWRAWDGEGFTVAFKDPYRSPPGDAGALCTPVNPERLRLPLGGVVRHLESGLYVAVMQGRITAPGGGAPAEGIHAATSPDLLHWSEPRLVLPAGSHQRYRCGNPPPLAYPSLLDPASPSRNFETVGRTAFLYATRFNVGDCRLGNDRDLVRIPVEITGG